MRTSLLLVAIIVFSISYGAPAYAENIFSTNLSLGSRNSQVTALQKILNRAPDTRITDTGPGSSGEETNYFGSLTKAAVIRFQEKYANEVLAPAGLTRGNGRVGLFTRSKLNALSAITTSPATTTTQVPPAATTTSAIAPVSYLTTSAEKIDIYAGDKMIENVQSKLQNAMNAIITSQSASTAMPEIQMTEVPSVIIKKITPQYGTPGTRVVISGTDIYQNSTIYFGSDYIIRNLDADGSGDFSFAIPTIPLGRYDLAVRTNGSVSSTIVFVVTDPKNPTVHIQNISPTTILYGETITITGSGFTPEGNTVVTNYQKFTNVPSADGKTLSVQINPEKLRAAANIGNKKRNVPMFLYVVNQYGFSDPKSSFTMTI